MDKALRQALRAVDLFESVDNDALEDIIQHLRLRTFEAQQNIVAYGDQTSDVFMILKGAVQVTVFNRAGRQVTFRDLHVGESFGELSAIDGDARSANVVALTRTTIAAIGPQAFLSLLRRHPEVAFAALRKLTRLVRLLSERVYMFSAPVPVRVCDELWHIARENMIGDNLARIVPAPKHADIASRINTHREAVSRTMSELARCGILKRGRGELLVLNVSGLASRAAGETEMAEDKRGG